MENKVRELIERFWNDVAGLPWQDKSWYSNEAIKEQTRQHFVNATVDDVLLAVKQEELIKEDDNADTTSKDA